LNNLGVSLAIVQSRAISGLSALPVRVEADLANGLPQFSIVGLPDAAVREARDRVRSAITNAGFEFPQRRVTVNLAPADLPKDSGRFDLPIALGILAASGQISSRHCTQALEHYEFVGELSLTGSLLPVRGAFALAMGVINTANSLAYLVLPKANQAEASLTESTRLCFAEGLRDVTDFLQKEIALPGPLPASENIALPTDHDWSDIRGQDFAKQAAIVAASGQHNLLMFGPPGVGKSMIASRIPGLLPPLSKAQACELAAIQSLDSGIDTRTWRTPPFRAPHHSTPSRAIIGGGQPIRPGEISLAHHGVLFLDELPEFARDALESLREPLETGMVSIARVRDRAQLPANVMLVAAMNPCPCGYFGAALRRRICKCSPDRIDRYRGKISGPLMDRFDIAIALNAVEDQALRQTSNNLTTNTTAEIAAGVTAARNRQYQRQAKLNSRLSVQELARVACLDAASERILQHAARQWNWSARSWHRVLRVARTIADIDASSDIDLSHLSQAIELRRAMDAHLLA
jgi:magnesium chelatase family protein